MSGLHLAIDANRCPTIRTEDDDEVAHYNGDTVHVDPDYAGAVWAVLTAVLAPDEVTVERLAERLLAQGGHAEYASEKIREIARDDVRIILAALADTSAQARHTDDNATGGGEDG